MKEISRSEVIWYETPPPREGWFLVKMSDCPIPDIGMYYIQHQEWLVCGWVGGNDQIQAWAEVPAPTLTVPEPQET